MEIASVTGPKPVPAGGVFIDGVEDDRAQQVSLLLAAQPQRLAFAVEPIQLVDAEGRDRADGGERHRGREVGAGRWQRRRALGGLGRGVEQGGAQRRDRGGGLAERAARGAAAIAAGPLAWPDRPDRWLGLRRRRRLGADQLPGDCLALEDGKAGGDILGVEGLVGRINV